MRRRSATAWPATRPPAPRAQAPSEPSGGAVGATIRRAARTDLDGIVHVHQAAFPRGRFFLTAMGPGFLREYYALVLGFERGILLVADREGAVIGFAAGFLDPAGFASCMAAARLRLAWLALRAALERPRWLPRLVHSVHRVRAAARGDVAPAPGVCQLSSLAVHPDRARRGVGRRLVASFVEEARALGAREVGLDTDAADNDPANAFYEQQGFRLARAYTTPDGRRMNHYVRPADRRGAQRPPDGPS